MQGLKWDKQFCLKICCIVVVSLEEVFLNLVDVAECSNDVTVLNMHITVVKKLLAVYLCLGLHFHSRGRWLDVESNLISISGIGHGRDGELVISSTMSEFVG